MFNCTRRLIATAVLSFAVASSAPAIAQAVSANPPIAGDGIVKVRSAYSVDETITRLKKDIADKGIRFFLEVDQSRLAAEAGIEVSPSTLLIFGNPPLGTQFLTAKPQAGLD